VADPDYLENEVRKLIQSRTDVSIQVIKGEELKNMGMNLHYEVGKGAQSPPRYVAVKY
jgi:leucyl aminopeptidase